ncbi:MAG: PIN domain-containing protein [Candidatus Limnocylindrales bacterium]
MLTLDTSGLFSLLNRRDPDHERAKNALLEAGRPYLVPIAILAEIAYLIEQRMPKVLDTFLADLESGAYSLDCGEDDLPRMRELVTRYADLSLGVADAAVIALAERSGGLVLTLDLRDFGVVAREGTIQLLPAAQGG